MLKKYLGILLHFRKKVLYIYVLLRLQSRGQSIDPFGQLNGAIGLFLYCCYRRDGAPIVADECATSTGHMGTAISTLNRGLTGNLIIMCALDN